MRCCRQPEREFPSKATLSKTEAALPNLAIFASGRGSNAEAIIRRFAQESDLEVAVIVTNNPKAGVIRLAEQHHIPVHVTHRSEFFSQQSVLPHLKMYSVDWIALAGFLWLVPQQLIRAYPGRIVNIHPALLPKFGGQGMYGERVHQAVYAAGEKESGITIHYVDEHYDEGEIIRQVSVPISKYDKPEDIGKKVLELEHYFYPIEIVRLMKSSNSIGFKQD